MLSSRTRRDFEPATLAGARTLLDEVFKGELTDEDWEHALGGVHALVWEHDELVGHGAVVMRRLLHGANALRTGYVEAVGVHPDARWRGHGAAIMRALERVIRGAYDLGALGATEEAISLYEAGRLAALAWPAARADAESGVVRTPGGRGLRARVRRFARPGRRAHLRLARRGRVVTLPLPDDATNTRDRGGVRRSRSARARSWRSCARSARGPRSCARSWLRPRRPSTGRRRSPAASASCSRSRPRAPTAPTSPRPTAPCSTDWAAARTARRATTP